MLKNIHVLIAPKSDESLLNNSDPHRLRNIHKKIQVHKIHLDFTSKKDWSTDHIYLK